MDGNPRSRKNVFKISYYNISRMGTVGYDWPSIVFLQE